MSYGISIKGDDTSLLLGENQLSYGIAGPFTPVANPSSISSSLVVLKIFATHYVDIPCKGQPFLVASPAASSTSWQGVIGYELLPGSVWRFYLILVGPQTQPIYAFVNFSNLPPPSFGIEVFDSAGNLAYHNAGAGMNCIPYPFSVSRCATYSGGTISRPSSTATNVVPWPEAMPKMNLPSSADLTIFGTSGGATVVTSFFGAYQQRAQISTLPYYRILARDAIAVKVQLSGSTLTRVGVYTPFDSISTPVAAYYQGSATFKVDLMGYHIPLGLDYSAVDPSDMIPP